MLLHFDPSFRAPACTFLSRPLALHTVRTTTTELHKNWRLTISRLVQGSPLAQVVSLRLLLIPAGA